MRSSKARAAAVDLPACCWRTIASPYEGTCSSRIALPLGHGFLDLTDYSCDRAALSFERSEPIPQSDDFSLFLGVHGGTSRKTAL
ncbi:hypothetical protein AS156_00110 [Bradyrhizobium macuxiense]|uniref:Uncharacterized protein n=1 Tax=Bradyrhizobium macuxiense TaxID=1755647 RepID=A0A120FP42_9BRAD|nr:hypothetical protein AS156_00110 [Bradyrhizobium macuxiense]